MPAFLWQTGVQRPEQVPRDAGTWSEKPISYRLLGCEDVAVVEAVMRHLRLANGVFRTTFRRRFAILDAQIAPFLRVRFDGELRVEDWAASDCLTSAEWAQSLAPSFPELRFTASDRMLELLEVTLPSGEVFIVQEDGEPIQYIRGPFVVPLHDRCPRRWLPNRYLKRRAWAVWKGLRTAMDLKTGWPSLSLIHPEARELSRSSAYFRVARHSVFDVRPEPVDVIRTMNIFNRGYFDDAMLQRGVEAVWRSLRPGGLWIVGRTEIAAPFGHDVSILERQAGGFAVVERIGTGSEIEALAAGFRDVMA